MVASFNEPKCLIGNTNYGIRWKQKSKEEVFISCQAHMYFNVLCANFDFWIVTINSHSGLSYTSPRLSLKFA